MLVGRDWAFVHIPRTAGISISKALLRRLGKPDDIGESLQEAVREHTGGHQHFGLTADAGDRFTFAFVRNPYARWASLYRHWRRYDPKISARPEVELAHSLSFPEFLEAHSENSEHTGWLRPQWSQLRYQDKEVRYVGRFENLDFHWKMIQRYLGWRPEKLEHANASPEKGDWRELYNYDAELWIRMHCSVDLEKLGYTCPL